MLQSLQATFSTSATIYRDSSPASTGGGEAAPGAAPRCLADAATTAASHTEALCKGMHSVLVQMERQPRHGAAAASLRASLSAALAECSRLDNACGCAANPPCRMPCATCHHHKPAPPCAADSIVLTAAVWLSPSRWQGVALVSAGAAWSLVHGRMQMCGISRSAQPIWVC